MPIKTSGSAGRKKKNTMGAGEKKSPEDNQFTSSVRDSERELGRAEQRRRSTSSAKLCRPLQAPIPGPATGRFSDSPAKFAQQPGWFSGAAPPQNPLEPRWRAAVFSYHSSLARGTRGQAAVKCPGKRPEIKIRGPPTFSNNGGGLPLTHGTMASFAACSCTTVTKLLLLRLQRHVAIHTSCNLLCLRGFAPLPVGELERDVVG